MSDVSEFLQSYSEKLQQGIADADMPSELTEQFVFDSLIKQDDGKEVYFITRKSDGLRAVLRITSAESGEDAVTEGMVLTKLDHPAIPKMLGTWEHNGRSFMVREYFAGDDLNAFIRKHGTLSREMLFNITLQLCDILTYIHGQNPAVIHRDIKPENIIISGKSDVKLIDFGIARDFKSETDSDRDTQIAGTRSYMAPEQFGSEQTDHRADIYSLGMVMVFMATGKTKRHNLKTIYPYKELVSIIEKCLRKDRDQRFKTAKRLRNKILWVQRQFTKKILVSAGICFLIAAAFLSGLFIGQKRGFQNGVDFIMDIPVDKNRPFTEEELIEPITFGSEYLDLAVRNILNKQQGDTIYRTEVNNRIDEIRIYGTYILHPDLEDELLKTHVGKGTVSYITDTGFRIDGRGDISSLTDIPNMYYLRNLILTSQSISDLSPLTGMKLEKINLSNNFVGNLLPLKDMVTLRELDVCQNPLRDLTPISRLLSLESLDISQTQVTDLMPLAELTKLQTLQLEYCDIEDIRVLAKLPNLQEVDLSNTLITDLSPLIRQHNPVTVRCVGLPRNVVDAVRNNPGIVLIEE
ncbi:MAG TPA: protein kinase [Clostridiaceae bacterium]|nr:protein kinase [Clostridiaceae bacterium]